MEVKKLSQVMMLSISTMVLVGCTGSKEPKKEVKISKPVVAVQSAKASIADLKHAGFNTINVKGKKLYSQNQDIRFSIDTKEKSGYLYIIYLDDKGETALLYPNAQTPLTELNGKYNFPEDFGGMKITATKECKGCKKELTTVYAILSKDPIADIKSLKSKDLPQSKGIDMSLPTDASKKFNINIGKIEFYVQ